MTARLGLIVTDACQVNESIKNGQDKEIDTLDGKITVRMTDKWAVICRSGFNGPYCMPHEYNTIAHMSAFKDIGVTEVVGVHSTGSLRPSLTPGTLVVPDDWIDFSNHRLNTTITGQRRYLTPSFSRKVRRNLIEAAGQSQVRFEDVGIYWQTNGPRLETKAEIKVMSNFADLVGMGLANEANLAQELGLEYAALCSVDNYANGLAASVLTDDMICKQSMKSAVVITKVLENYGAAAQD